ncbi:hypothetical protein N9N67_03595 [Bacteriovoracaceae bacterium]|nr:hypothetical protein [Bacteriovoracaceae bacterium]
MRKFEILKQIIKPYNFKRFLFTWIGCTIFSYNALSFNFTFIGSEKTKRKAIEIELKDLKNHSLNNKTINEIKNRLWNMRIFSQVMVRKTKKNHLVILVQDRWTLIPIFKATSGGGSEYMAIGAYDVNFLGHYFELGGQYESLNGQPAGVLWYRNPQFNKNRLLKIGVDLWSINRIRFFFDGDGEESFYYTLKRNKINVFLEKSSSNNEFSQGIGINSERDVLSETGLSDLQKEQNDEVGFEIDQSGETHSPYLYFTWGRLFYKNYLVFGQELSARVDFHPNHFKNRFDESTTGSYVSQNLNFKKYFLKNRKNFAWNFNYFSTSHPQIQYFSFLGGFGEVRGYQDGQFYDKTSWQNNFEYRFDLTEISRFTIQGVLFTDQGKVEEDLSELIYSKNQILLSSGLGVRIISPSIYRFVGRIDYAQTHTRYMNREVSIGVQQFF